MTKSKLSITERALIEMLTENTGRALCDSGDYYGRHWRRNAGHNFLAEPATSLKFRIYETSKGPELEFEVTHSVFHWLNDRLDYEPRMTGQMTRFGNKRNLYGLELAEEYAEHLVETKGATGLYDEGSPTTVNTYNGEDLLSQTIQYVYFEVARQGFVILQIHGGCDVRGGYTRPRIFRVMDECAMFDNAKATIWPDVKTDTRQLTLFNMGYSHPPYWRTDDGYHWYAEGLCGLGAGKQLENYEPSGDITDRGDGKVYVDEDGHGYCPKTGAILKASF